MKTKNFIQLFFYGVLSVVLISCVPKATESKATCGTNQAFNSVTRSCYSIVEPRTKPVGTFDSGSLNQETAKTFTLTYTDTNNNAAISCKAYNPSANITLISTSIINGAMFSKADDLFNAVDNLTNALGVGTAEWNLADPQRTLMIAALKKAKASFTYTTIQAQLLAFRTEAQAIIAAANPRRVFSSTVETYSLLSISRTTVFDTALANITNNCECSGGVCTTTVSSRMRQNGSATFLYTITDQDGESVPKTVNLSIVANSTSSPYLKPSASSAYVTGFVESTTAAPGFYAVNIPAGSDYFSSPLTYKFAGTKDASGYGWTTPAKDKGKVFGCMDLVGSDGPTDTSCTYVPVSGDTNYLGAAPTKASALVQGISFTAKAEGTYGNNYRVQFIDASSTTALVQAANFGLASSFEDAYVRVVDNTIQIYVSPNTTSFGVVQAILQDVKAISMVDVVNVSGSTFTTMALPISLSGGTDAFDKIAYSVGNGYTYSTNTATVMFTMAPGDDAPLSPTQYNSAYMPLTLSGAVTSTMAEGNVVGQTITLPYFDADNSPVVKPVSCAIDFATLPNIGLGYKLPTTCTCDVAGVCSATVVPNALFNGIGKFSYTITTTDQYSVATRTSSPQSVSVTVTEVNDPPTMAITSATSIASAVPTTFAAPIPNPLHTQENSTSAPSSAYICFTATPGGGADEATQTLTITPIQLAPTPNPLLVLSFGTVLTPGAIGNGCGAGQYKVPFTSTQNQSGTTNIKITVTDNGTTNGVSAPLSTFTTIPLTVDSVDDPPYFIQTITSVQTNEGGAVVAGPFQVDEDTGSSPDEDVQQIRIANITSDNTAVLPVSAISVFYDLNDNGVEDAGESRTFGSSSTVLPASQDLEAVAGADVKGHKFYLKLSPVAGVSGNTNITVTINDGILGASNSHMVSTSFSLIINSIAAIHGGWANISAIGIKTDKNGAPAATSDVVCNFDTDKCDGATSCSRGYAPNSVVVPSVANAIYWDSANKRCYRSQTAADKFSWIEMKTTCPITKSGGINFIYDSSLLPAQSIPTTTAINQYYYNPLTNVCYYSTQPTPGTFSWNSPYIPSKVTLTWNSFTLTGSGSDAAATIEGWNVYRREKGYDYDFKNGFLKLNSTDTKTISDPQIKTFTDKTAIAGKVYYYLVRPVDSIHHLPTYTFNVNSEVRVLAPTENYAFVHRWMVNQEICNSMHMTTLTANKVDPTNNYRCPYKGPGEGTGANAGYYDIGKDMLVDISESGCPYSKSPSCDPVTGCVGIGDPNTRSIPGNANEVYYDRRAGMCYMYNGAAWVDYNSAVLNPTIVAKTNTALNAPLTNISQAKASAICSARTIGATLASALSGPAPLAAGTTLSLPTKKEYIAYSAAPYNMSDSLVTDLEQGFSLNVQSRCNSSNANGIDTAFSDSPIPSTSYIFSLPGTASSTIRSIYTGSVPFGVNASTESCSSRYGVQDVYGNVAEWVKDSMTCATAIETFLTGAINAAVTTITVADTSAFTATGSIIVGTERMTYTGKTATTFTGVTRGANSTTAAAHANADTVAQYGANDYYVCKTNTGTDLAQYDFLSGAYAVSPAIPTYRYKFDLITGPFNDINTAIPGPDGADGFLIDWDFRNKIMGAGKFSFPMGMPINVDIGAPSSPLVSSPTLPYLLDIGPTAGITSTQLHEDGIIVNGAAVNNLTTNPTQTGSFAQGGSYLSGNRSGRYSSELIPDANLRSDVGFRCYIPVDKANYPTDAGRHTYSY